MKIIPNATGFELKNAASMAAAAHLVYESWPLVESKIRQYGYGHFQYFDKSETQALLAADDGTILLAFRGTEPDKLQDIMADLNCGFVPGPYGKVHSGFNTALNYILPEVLQAIKQIRTKNQSLWVSGHSLGGALAALATAYLGENRQHVNGLYTFGMPRVGDSTFADYFNMKYKRRTFRFVNNNDLVTRVPMRAMGFSHVGTHYYFDEEGKLHLDEKLDLWTRFTNAVNKSFEELANVAMDGVKDHSMDMYLAHSSQTNTQTFA